MNKELLLSDKEIAHLAITEMEFIQLEYAQEILNDELQGEFLEQVIDFLIFDSSYDFGLFTQFPHLAKKDMYDLLDLKREIAEQVRNYF